MSLGIIFDMDGVLLDTFEAHLVTWQQVAAAAGFSFTREEFLALFGKTSKKIAEAIWQRPFSREEIEKLDAHKESLFRDVFRQSPRFVDGVRELIARLQQAKIPFGIGSSAIRENVDLAIELLELKNIASVSLSEVAHAKPAPDIFLLAAERMKMSPQNCIVIEDSHSGWCAAAAANMKCIAYVDPARGEIDTQSALCKISHMNEISLDFLKEIAAM